MTRLPLSRRPGPNRDAAARDKRDRLKTPKSRDLELTVPLRETSEEAAVPASSHTSVLNSNDKTNHYKQPAASRPPDPGLLSRRRGLRGQGPGDFNTSTRESHTRKHTQTHSFKGGVFMQNPLFTDVTLAKTHPELCFEAFLTL